MKPAQKWSAQAPSNIALIKYMGKTGAGPNRPTNSSLSYTLTHLKSLVELETISSGEDIWEPLRTDFEGRELPLVELSEKGKQRFLAHLKRIKEEFEFEGAFVVRSANDFPSDCGLASSASSFAALTMAALKAVCELKGCELPPLEAAAEISRKGSGSSCRSFFTPWAFWSAEGGVRAANEIKVQDLLHQVIAVDDKKKLVSSSEAHTRVTSSLLFQGRPERAELRARALIKALGSEWNWKEAFEITWAEFWDMHALFETSVPSFGYMTGASLEVLDWVRNSLWRKNDDGPLVTMDAGPNIHLLYRNDPSGREAFMAVEKKFSARFKIYSSETVR